MTQEKTNWSVHLEVMEEQGYLYDIHAKKMETNMCDIHTKIMDTQDICVTFMQRIVWDSSFQKKRKKDVAVHTT